MTIHLSIGKTEGGAYLNESGDGKNILPYYGNYVKFQNEIRVNS